MLPSEKRKNSLFLISWFGLFVAVYFLSRLSQSDDFHLTWMLYAFAFSAYISLLFQAHRYSKNYFYFGVFIIAMICMMAPPYLSNDYFRFLWDGEMMHLGINPYSFTPNQIVESTDFSSCYYLDLYAGMGELSRSNYSCYPTINQLYFYLSTGWSKDIWTNILILRVLILLTVVVSIFYLEKVLQLLKLNAKRGIILLLNPLVLIESFGNVHFELPMVALFIIALHFVLTDKMILGGLFFAASVHLKLIPLLLLPFFISFLGWKKAVKFYAVVGISTVLLFLALIRLDNYANFFLSLRLYFKEFEFNSFLLYPYLQYGQAKFGWNLTSLYAPKLARLALLLVLGIAWHKRTLTAQNMIKRMLLGVMVYYFLTSTVHPWYWILPLGISVFYFSWSLLLISFLATLSYGIYHYGLDSDYRVYLAWMNLGAMLLFFWEYFQPQKFNKPKPEILA